MTAAERQRKRRARKRGAALTALTASRRQIRAVSEGVVDDYTRLYGGVRQGAMAAAAVGLKAVAAAQELAAKGGEENLAEAARRMGAAMILLEAAEARLPAPAAEPPPLSVALPQRPDESDEDYDALIAWYQGGCLTDPPPGNADWASRAALAAGYSDMAEGAASVRQGVRIGLPAHALQGHALLAKLGRDTLAAVTRTTEVPGEQ